MNESSVRELTESPEEYHDRVKGLCAALRSDRLDGTLVFNPDHIFWLTGFQTIGYFTFQALFITPDQNVVLVSRTVNQPLARINPIINSFVAIWDTEIGIEALTNVLNQSSRTHGKLGLETDSNNFTINDYQFLTSHLQSSVVPWNYDYQKFRRRKTANQLTWMKRAGHAAVKGLEAAVSAIHVGASENDVAAAMHHGSISAGSEYLGHPPLVVSGPRTALCFAMWKRRVIEPQDVVLLESAGCINRYHAMVSTSVVVGSATADQRESARVILEVLETAIDTVKPGIRSRDVDAACRNVTDQANLSQYFLHRTGYGIGIGFPPNWSEGHFLALRKDDDTVLEPGMTFHCVPTLFRDSFGMCFSTSIVVTDTGCEILTPYPRALIELSS